MRGAFGLPVFTMAATPPPINAEWLARMRSTKPQLLRSLFGMFLDDEPARLATLAEAVAKGDLKLTRYHAHSLKGAAATMGMEPLRDACRELEFAAKAEPAEVTALTPALERLIHEAETVFVVMRQELAHP